MRALKYILSLFVLIAVTLAALYLPGVYFRNYHHSTMIEEIEQYSYDELESSKANAWQIYKMFENENYTSTVIYMRDSLDEIQNRKIDDVYIEMIWGVFQKYFKIAAEVNTDEDGDMPEKTISNSEENISLMTLESYLKEWEETMDEWQVEQVELFNLIDIFNSRVVNVQLYGISLQIPDRNVTMYICFNPDSEIFYKLFVENEQYPFEAQEEVEDTWWWELYDYYCEYQKDGYVMEKDDKNRLMDTLRVDISPGFLYIGT